MAQAHPKRSSGLPDPIAEPDRTDAPPAETAAAPASRVGRSGAVAATRSRASRAPRAPRPGRESEAARVAATPTEAGIDTQAVPVVGDGPEAPPDTPKGPPITLASGIFITGNVALVAGSRYTLQADGDRFQVLGPVDVDPARVAIERAMSGMDATAFEGRLVISEPGRVSGGVVLAFMSLAGGSPVEVADALVRLADQGNPT